MNKAKNVFRKSGLFIKSCFTSVDNNEPRMLTLVKKDGTQTFISSVLCALFGILIGFFILLCINAQHAGEAMGVILKNFLNFKTSEMQVYYLGSTLVKVVPLALCGLSVLFAFKSGLFNIGVGGQYCIGIAVSLYAAIAWQLPWYACVILAGLGAAVWGAISGMFKALFNVNEVIACIMTNWIALYLTNMILGGDKVMNNTLSETYSLKSAAPQAILPDWGLSEVFENNRYVSVAIIFVVIIAVIVLILLTKTKFGYEIRATGYNKNAAKYAGMKDKKNIILTMAISGMLAGLAAAFYYLTGIEQYKTSSSVPMMGFNGIAVAFLGGLNPIGVLLAALFIQSISLGGSYIDTTYYNPQVADLIIAIIIYLCAFVLFIKQIMTTRLGKVTAKLKGIVRPLDDDVDPVPFATSPDPPKPPDDLSPDENTQAEEVDKQ